ncbi:MAG TPA: hypothetical protein VNO30_36515 [Kofleriaceae bacterium]|nr:hypothetical protein [Kofleriaceae bacterium]
MSVDRWKHQEIVFQRAGQSLHYDPPEGRPSGTPTVAVLRAETGHREAATVGACSVDAVRTALQTPGIAGMSTLLLADGAGVARGRRYQLCNDEGEHEWIEVRAVSGARVTTRRPLLFYYPARSPLVGCRISVAVDPAWAADPAKLSDRSDPGELEPSGYLLHWAYTVDGVALAGVSFADLVRQAALELVTPMDIDERFPGWLASLPSEHRESQGADLILEAVAGVKLDALGSRHAMRRIRDVAVLRELVMLRASLIAVEHNALFGRASELDLSTAERRYHARRDELLRDPGDPTGAAARSGRSRGAR